MNGLHDFIRLLSGSFDNSEQWEHMQREGNTEFPFAKHVNTVCNERIAGLPALFDGVFLIEESYFTSSGSTHASPHLFLFTGEEAGVRLTSYEIPQGYDKNTFSHAGFTGAAYAGLRASQKFTPALYTCRDGVWEGGSVSMFSPVLKFTLLERFSEERLEVSESMEVNGKRTFGYDVPILYKRIQGEQPRAGINDGAARGSTGNFRAPRFDMGAGMY